MMGLVLLRSWGALDELLNLTEPVNTWCTAAQHATGPVKACSARQHGMRRQRCKAGLLISGHMLRQGPCMTEHRHRCPTGDVDHVMALNWQHCADSASHLKASSCMAVLTLWHLMVAAADTVGSSTFALVCSLLHYVAYDALHWLLGASDQPLTSLLQQGILPAAGQVGRGS
jgi:hypothetical protein